MSEITAQRTIDSALTSKVFDKHRNGYKDLSRTLYSVFAFIMGVLLVCLGLRLLLSLLLINAPIIDGLTTITDPAVMPFTRVFNDAHSVLQASTAFAFSVYYLVYGIVFLVTRIAIRKSQLA